MKCFITTTVERVEQKIVQGPRKKRDGTEHTNWYMADWLISKKRNIVMYMLFSRLQKGVTKILWLEKSSVRVWSNETPVTRVAVGEQKENCFKKLEKYWSWAKKKKPSLTMPPTYCYWQWMTSSKSQNSTGNEEPDRPKCCHYEGNIHVVHEREGIKT